MGKAITKDSVFDSDASLLKRRQVALHGHWVCLAWLYCTYATSAVFPYRSGQSINLR